MDGQLRILIADDDHRARAGVHAFLAAMLRCTIVGEATDGQDAVAQVALHRPDAVVLDLHMPGMDGVQAARIIKAQWPATAILALSMYAGLRADALAAGADIFVHKGDPPMQLIEALHAIVPHTAPDRRSDKALPKPQS